MLRLTRCNYMMMSALTNEHTRRHTRTAFPNAYFVEQNHLWAHKQSPKLASGPFFLCSDALQPSLIIIAQFESNPRMGGWLIYPRPITHTQTG